MHLQKAGEIRKCCFMFYWDCEKYNGRQKKPGDVINVLDDKGASFEGH